MTLLHKLYSITIDRSKFREVAQRYAVFIFPLFYWGTEIHKIGIILAIAGVIIRAWAAGYLKKDQELAKDGPYMLARHPLYLGSCTLALGLILTIQHWFIAVILGGLTALVYNHTIRHEEKNLRARFGSSYTELSKNVGPLWPKLPGVMTILTKPGRFLGGFSFKQYLKNKEYECLLGVIAVYGILFYSHHITH